MSSASVSDEDHSWSVLGRATPPTTLNIIVQPNNKKVTVNSIDKDAGWMLKAHLPLRISWDLPYDSQRYRMDIVGFTHVA